MILYSDTATDHTLQSYTRLLLGDPVSAPLTMFTKAEITNALNVAYQELWDIARRLDVGWGQKTAYETSVADQILYDLPTDLDGRIVDVELETSGKNLDTDTTAISTFLEPAESNVALQLHRESKLYIPKYVFIQGQKYGIVSPPSTGGTNSIRLLYEAELTTAQLLVNDADEPDVVPESDHPLLCYMAAITLKISKDLSTEELRREAARKYPLFVEGAAEPILDTDFQIPCAGKQYNDWRNKTGFLVRE